MNLSTCSSMDRRAFDLPDHADYSIKLDRLKECIDHLSDSETENEVIQRTVQAARYILGDHAYCLGILDRNKIVTRAAEPASVKKADILELKGNIAAETLLNRKTYIIEKFKEFPNARPAVDALKSGVSIPIGRLGVFQAASMEEGAFPREDIQFLELLIVYTSEAIQRIRLNRVLVEQTMIDMDTGAYHERYLDTIVKREIKRAIRNNRAIGIVCVDVANWSDIHVSCGYPASSELMRCVTRVLLKSVRENDAVVRRDGNGFTVVCPESRRGGEIIRDRIYRNISLCEEFEQRIGSPPQLLVGYAYWHPTAENTMTEVIQRAKDRMTELTV